ncbi:MAG: hypothetical protein ACP5JJ_15915, partial [Anaerolineae bacterium]
MKNQRLSLAIAATILLTFGPSCGRPDQAPAATRPAVLETPPSEPTSPPGSASTSEAEAIEPSVPLTGAEPAAVPAYDGLPLPTQHGAFFSGSGVCAGCHTDMVDEEGTDLSIDTNWRTAIMANASRDPYWRATVQSEVLELPNLKTVIEDKCATCHTPMARLTAMSAGQGTSVLDAGFLDPQHVLHGLAIDGVSCTLCHQIEEVGLGTPGSFSGGFSIDMERPAGERLIYGPFPAAKGPASVMQDVSGYIPVRGPQTTQSELCATCHTLYTPYVDANDEVAGEFPEQVPYLEWRHSAYEQTHACQDCHMPPAQGSVRLASVGGGPPRSPFAQHLFIGGNAYVLTLLQTFGEARAATASSEQFQ